MPVSGLPTGFRFIVAFLALSVLLLVAGQTLAIFNYDLTVRLGLQESVDEVGEHGVQVGRAFGAGDTVVYIPLIIASLIGLLRRNGWALITTAAVAGISVYWTVTILSMLLFLPGTPGYAFTPGIEIWLFIGAYLAFGLWCLAYLLTRGDSLLR